MPCSTRSSHASVGALVGLEEEVELCRACEHVGRLYPPLRLGAGGAAAVSEVDGAAGILAGAGVQLDRRREQEWDKQEEVWGVDPPDRSTAVPRAC